MAQVKMLTHRIIVASALLGAGAAVLLGAGAAADGCYYLGSLVIFR